MKYDRQSAEIVLMCFHRMHHHAVQYQLNKKGLQIGHPMLLMLLAELGKKKEIVNPKILAERMGVSPAAITNSLNSLERLGLIQKNEDENDLRCKCIKITSKGKMAVTQCREIFNTIHQGLFKGFTEEEKEELSGYLLRLCKNLSDMGANAPDFLFPKEPKIYS